jgi:hypothetical protein
MILKYQKIIEKFTDGSSTTHRLQEPDYQEGSTRCTELCTIGFDTYVHVPDDLVLPEQPDVLDMEAVSLTPELREEIKAASPHVRLSYKRLQERIRSRYSVEDEQYLTRISIGDLAGTYTMQEDEPTLVAAYQAWVEECREIARLERVGWGL